MSREATLDDVVSALNDVIDALDDVKREIKKMNADLTIALDSVEGVIMLYSGK